MNFVERVVLPHCGRDISLYGILCAAIILLTCARADATSLSSLPDTKTDSIVNQLPEVVAMGFNPSVPGQTIGKTQIENLPSSSVADALKYLSGVQIKDYGGLGGQKTINVRSLGSQHVGVYLDGVRITNVQNGTVDLGKYSLSTLESVSLYNANKAETLMTASEYASASTVYLKTKRPEHTGIRAAYTFGSFNTHKADLNLSLSRYGFIDAGFTHSSGNYPFRYHTEYEDTSGVRRNSDITMFRIEGFGYYKGFQLHAYYFNSRRGLPGGIVRRLSDMYTDVGREWDRNFFTQLSYRKEFRRWALRAIIKYADDFLHYRSDYPENISVHSNNRYRQQDMYGAVSASYAWGNVSGSVSTDFRWSDLVSDVKNFKYVYRLDSKTSLSLFYRLGGFNANASLLYTHTTDHTRNSADPLSRFTWNILASYQWKDFSFRTFYKSVFRVPTLNDLYYTLVGNRFLKPEYTKQLDLGITYTKSWINLQLDGYYNRVEDRIVCLPLKGSYQWTMLNYGYTRCLGLDLSANMTFGDHSLMLTGTFQDDRNLTNPGEDSYNDYIAYSPRWSFSGIYTFTWKGLHLSLSHMFVGKRYWTAENSIEPPLKAYNCTDLKVGYDYKMFTIEAECQDIFDVRYELIQRWPMPGRRFAVTLKMSINRTKK